MAIDKKLIDQLLTDYKKPEDSRRERTAQVPRSIRKLLAILIGAVLVGVLLYKSQSSIAVEGFNWATLGRSLRRTHVSFLLLSLATVYVCLAIRALRWMRFSRSLGHAPFGKVYEATVAGFSSVFILGRAGEPVRPLLIARKGNLPVAGMFGVYFLERVTDLAATAVLAGIALMMFSHESADGSQHVKLLAAARTTGLLILSGLAVTAALLVYFRLHGAAALERTLARVQKLGGWRAKLATLMTDFAEGIQGIRTLGDLTAIVFYSAVHWFLVGLIYLWVPWSFGGQLRSLTLSGAMLVLAFTAVGSLLQLPGVGGGAQVASFLAFTLIFGIEKEPAAAAAILIWLITFAGPCLVGVPFLLREGWHLGTLRTLPQTDCQRTSLKSAMAERIIEAPESIRH